MKSCHRESKKLRQRISPSDRLDRAVTGCTSMTLGPHRARWFLLVLAVALLVSAPALAGAPSGIHRDPGLDQGDIDFSLHFLFPPTPEVIDQLKAIITEANRIICDATEGQMRFGTVTLTGGLISPVQKAEADGWIYLNEGRPRAAMCQPPDPNANPTPEQQRCVGLEQVNHRMYLYLPKLSGIALAHELAHLGLDVGDEYEENPKSDGCSGIGLCIECADLSHQNSCLMQTDVGCVGNCDDDPNGLCIEYNTEFCTESRHDTLEGDPDYYSDPDPGSVDCPSDQSITCQPGRYCTPITNLSNCNNSCCLFNPDAQVCDYTGARQSRWSVKKTGQIRSCWSHLAWTFPEFMTPPGGLPAIDPPADCDSAFDPDTDIVDNTSTFHRIALVLDRSGSMAYHPDEGFCKGQGCTEVCDNGFDDNGVGGIDEDPCATGRLRRLMEATNLFIGLLRGSGAQASIISFSNCPTPELDFTEVTDNTDSSFFAKVNALKAGGYTGIGDALEEARQKLVDAGPKVSRAILLVTDGHQNCGENDDKCCDPVPPEQMLDALNNDLIALYPLILGKAGNEDLLASLAADTGGWQYHAENFRELIPAFVNQFAHYSGTGVLVPQLAYRVNRLASLPEPSENVRDTQSWLDGQDTPIGDPGIGDPPYSTNRFELPVEAGTERLLLTFGGDMDNLEGFGLRVVLDGPNGPAPTHFDTDAPGPDPFLRVDRGEHFLALVLEDPNPGLWQVEINVPASLDIDAIQTGYMTALVDHARVFLGAALQRRTIEAVGDAVNLTVHPSFDMPLRQVAEMDARVRRPDGTWEDLSLIESDTHPGQYGTWITDLPAQGRYEVRVRMRTGTSAEIDAGEPILGSGPTIPGPAPDLVRTELLHFWNPVVGAKVCADPLDCDDDGATAESATADFDGDGLPDDYDPDADDDGVPDTIEGIGLPDTDSDGTPDYHDEDSDGDGAADPNDPSNGAFHNILRLPRVELGTCGQTLQAHATLSTDEQGTAMTIGLQWSPADHLEILAINPGPDVPASAVQSFSANIESNGLNAGEALAEMTLVAGEHLGPGNNLRVLTLDYRARPAATPGSAASICFADRLGVPPRNTELTVERIAGPVTVTPDKFCGAVDFLGDVDPPVLECPPDETLTVDAQCMATWSGSAQATDDCDPAPSVSSDPSLSVTWDTAGLQLVTFTATDSAGNASACHTWITVLDVDLPVGSITAPPDGSCTASPVTVEDDYTDACDGTALTRTYDPPGGPTYTNQDDYLVNLEVSDASGITAMDSVSFTIDLTAPFVDVLDTLDQLDLPSGRPFTEIFLSDDDDGVGGDVSAERVLLDGCLTYDGAAYGDADGLLRNETMVFDYPTTCEVTARCGLSGLDRPVLRAEADDCAGNAGLDEKLVSVVPPLTQSDCQVELLVTRPGGTAEVSWIPVFAAQSYDVVRGEVEQLAVGATEVDLGTVVCLAEDTPATSVTDGAVPAAGEAFFYLTRYNHFATTSEYGWSSSGLPERPAAGDCAK